MSTLTAVQANQIYDILVREAGADNRAYSRECFTLTVTAPTFREYRFGGSLGFGGKFWNANDEWYVNMYTEDFNPGRVEVMVATNATLARLKYGYEARAEVLS